MTQKWKIMYSSNDKIIWINYTTMKQKICYLTYKDRKTPLPKGWERWFSTTYQLFYYRLQYIITTYIIIDYSILLSFTLS